MIVAEWKAGSRIAADAEKVYQEISSIGNDATTEQVLEMAKDEGTELHKCFDWNDTTAANKYRLWQARHVINCLVVKVQDAEEENPKEIRVMQNVGNAYHPISYIVQRPDLYETMLKNAEKEMKSFAERYQQIAQLDGVLSAIDEYFE